MTLRPSDPEKRREAQRRWNERQRAAARRYEDRVREETLAGERGWSSIPPANPERREREWERAYGSLDRVKWVQAQPCLVCGRTPSENAHIESGGTGRKADADLIVPLCTEHHTGPEGYDENKATFEATHALDLRAEARRLDEAWEAYREAA